MLFIYISLTKGQRSAFKRFLSGENELTTVANKFLDDPLRCLRLYRCFKEANDKTMCNTIEGAKAFDDKIIDLWGNKITISDIKCISLFLTSSFNKKWKRLNLNYQYIQDKGLKILYRGLSHTTDITINKLWLADNGLTAQSSSLISELTVKFKVKGLVIAGNYTIGDDLQLYSM